MTKPKYAPGELVRIRRPRISVRDQPDRMSPEGLWLDTWTVDHGEFLEDNYSLAGRLWHAVKGRCDERGTQQRNNPRYQGCTLGFECFQEFAAWCNSQYGYGFRDQNDMKWEIDKDILVPGNRVYGPDFCCFVPRRINSLFTFSSKMRGDLPLGVSPFKGDPKVLRARIRIGNGKSKHLGIFRSAIDAHRAWQEEKSRIIREEALLLPDEMQHVAQGLIRHAAMIEEDIRNGLETIR
ncbi:hypothetical protein OO258_26395 [Pseudomonas sp. DCB_BI]|uniref:hypothetical protein n=1 Tax=Pseudomonas sp. DCB_BI TaxID=2993594 RepID=UPI00224B8C0C|nr:hypothetical protein [Pseudomonas sp. DCB_BI]MCX2891761.1 hypothetical protein [Pseudomonas sp. DCB_BI]